MFNLALILASFIASSTISIPYTLVAFCAKNSDIDPIPQYISNTVSFSFNSAYSNALLYKTSVWTGLTWKNDNGDISNTKSPM